MVDHGKAVGEAVRLLEVLRGEQHRGASGGDGAHDVPHLVAAARIEARGGLVEEQQLRRDDEAGRDVEPPAHAAGVGAHLLRRPLGEVERGEQLVAARARRAQP